MSSPDELRKHLENMDRAFGDKTPKHDALQIWCIRNALVISAYALCLLRRPRNQCQEKVLSLISATAEFALQAPYRREVYHLDVRIDVKTEYCERPDGKTCKHWENREVVGVECKPHIESFGDLIRQIRRYQVWGGPQVMVVVSPDDRFVQEIEAQGFAFFGPTQARVLTDGLPT